MFQTYKGRIIKYGLDVILDRRGETGIKEAITKKPSLKKTITKEECLEYLTYRKSIQCLDVCKTDYVYEKIVVDKYNFVRDIDHIAYISYTDLCRLMPSHIPLEDYGEDILRRVLVDRYIDRARGVYHISIYCPSTFLTKHFLLSGCRTEYQNVFLDIMTTLERIPVVVRAESLEENSDLMYIHAHTPWYSINAYENFI